MTARTALIVGLVLATSVCGNAQAFGILQQDARPHVAGLDARAMGGAVAAVASSETAFFYNPAHLARIDLSRPKITFIGAGVSASSEILDEYRFIRDELEPAIDEGLEEIRAQDYDRLIALYDRALELGSSQSAATLTAYGPSVQMSVSGSEAFGIGLFGTNTSRMQFIDVGVGIPRVDAYNQLDIIVPVAGAVTIPNTNIALGLAASYTRRYLTAKGALLEELDPDEEHLYVLKGSALSFDAGVHMENVLPNVDLGAAVYQLFGGGFDYSYSSRIDVTGNDGPDDEAEIVQLEERFNARSASPSYRVGMAYRLPVPESAAGVLSNVTLSADYVSSSTSEFDQTTGAHIRVGLGADIGGILNVRSGYSQGYPSIGAGLNLRFVKLDYAYYGVEDGRKPGQFGRFNHQLQVRFGLF